ncbi:DUF502 domain-containing protein [Flagellimonas nanhaiensis]|uniref:DUF502 domain-containing protein n=1 Tax=Flagellimonas nanhaiensis TaxID=2292706 RepID=A0A371JMZ3_9FLAO|nr:DUF502 domain-containing protein [Allomuricauda nanhaiensis]RDY58609.1 DUF502 domain-containing protein [Allomuricauda nanhaiensis]
MKRLINYLFQGILYSAPLAIIIYVLYRVFVVSDNLLQKTIEDLFHVTIPGLGILSLLLFLVIIGFLGNTIIAKPMKRIFKKTVDQVPLLRFVHSALTDLFSAFVGKEKKFNRPVLVKLNLHYKLEKLGFITEDDLDFLGQKDKVAVYFPHSYNISGELFIVPREHITPLDLPSSEVMKFIVSAGLMGQEK